MAPTQEAQWLQRIQAENDRLRRLPAMLAHTTGQIEPLVSEALSRPLNVVAASQNRFEQVRIFGFYGPNGLESGVNSPTLPTALLNIILDHNRKHPKSLFNSVTLTGDEPGVSRLHPRNNIAILINDASSKTDSQLDLIKSQLQTIIYDQTPRVKVVIFTDTHPFRRFLSDPILTWQLKPHLWSYAPPSPDDPTTLETMLSDLVGPQQQLLFTLSAFEPVGLHVRSSLFVATKLHESNPQFPLPDPISCENSSPGLHLKPFIERDFLMWFTIDKNQHPLKHHNLHLDPFLLSRIASSQDYQTQALVEQGRRWANEWFIQPRNRWGELLQQYPQYKYL